MATEKNREITIHRVPLGKPFIGMNQEALGKSVGSLTLNGLRLYLYLCSNKDGFHWSLNSTNYKDWLGWFYDTDGSKTRKAIRDGLSDLEKSGYMKKIDEEHFEFFDEPIG